MSEPITTALRGLLCAKPKGDPCWDAMDAVDAVHAALEAENAALRQRVEELDNVGGSMHDGESITDELRRVADTLVKNHMQGAEIKSLKRGLIGCADRIDAEHESACKRERGEGIKIAEEAALEEMAEYGLVHKNKEHVISHTTVEVMPHMYGKKIGRGTCHADETDVIKCWVKCKGEPSTERMELIHVMECSACGGTYEHVNGDYEYCPHCGRRKVVGE